MSNKKKSNRFILVVRLVGNGIRHMILHNRWAKLIALLISVVIWAGLISQDPDLTRDKTFQNVSVSINNAPLLKSRGYIIVSNLEEALTDVSAVASVPQQKVDDADPSAYNFRVDLSRIQSAGEHELRIMTNKSSTYGEITSISPSTVTVQVAQYEERQRVPLNLEIIGEEPEGWHMKKSSIDPVLMTVSGPKELVQSISRGKVFLNLNELTWKEGSWLDNLEIKLFNKSGEEVSNAYINITTGAQTIVNAVIEENIVPTRSFDVEEAVSELIRPAEGYRLVSMSVSPETIEIADASNVLDSMEFLALEGYESLQDVTKSDVKRLTVLKPSADSEILTNGTVTVRFEIAPIDSD